MLYPKKNLIPPFTDSAWRLHPAAKIIGPYEIEYNQTAAYSTSAMDLNLVPGKSYNFSIPETLNGAALYISKIKDGVTTYPSFAPGATNFTIVGEAGARYLLGFHDNARIGNKVTYKNFMLVEGTAPEPFEPYQLTNKRAAVRKDIIAPDILGTSHNFVSGNLYKVKQDVRLTKAKFESLTAGTFNVAIYEWVEGTGKVGQPLFMRDANYGVGVFSYDFGGIILKAGKTYFIGRYEQTNAAAIKRVTGGTINVGNYVEWVGGTTLSQTTTIYPTSYYSFFAIEFELVKLAKTIPVASGVNSIPLINGQVGYGVTVTEDSFVTYNRKPMTKVEVTNITGSQAKYGGTNFYVQDGKTYYMQTVLYDPLNYYRYSTIYNGSGAITNQLTGTQNPVITDLGNGYKLLEAKFTANFTGYLTHGWIHYITVGQNYKMWFGETTVQEGAQQPYAPANKPALLVPKKNLFPNEPSYWESGSIGSTGLLFTGTSVRIKDFVQVEPNTQYIQSVPKANAKTIIFYYDNDKNFISTPNVFYRDGATFTTPGNCKYIKIMLRDDDSAVTVYVDDVVNKYIVQIEKGANKTPYEPYQLTNKKAVLYPQKNLFTFEGCKITSGGGSSFTVISPNEVIVSSVLNAFTAIETAKMTVKPNTQYTISYEVEHITGIDPPRVSPRKGSDRSGITLTDGAGSKTMTFNTGSETEIYFLLYANLADVSAPQSNRYKRVQVEEGAQTPYEPYRLGNKRA